MGVKKLPGDSSSPPFESSLALGTPQPRPQCVVYWCHEGACAPHGCVRGGRDRGRETQPGKGQRSVCVSRGVRANSAPLPQDGPEQSPWLAPPQSPISAPLCFLCQRRRVSHRVLAFQLTPRTLSLRDSISLCPVHTHTTLHASPAQARRPTVASRLHLTSCQCRAAAIFTLPLLHL